MTLHRQADAPPTLYPMYGAYAPPTYTFINSFLFSLLFLYKERKPF